jgi:hypothetical protein
MSITLCVRADDPQVEKLLAFLDAQPLGSAENKIWLLGRAQKWLSASIAVSYDTATVKATLGLDDAVSLAPEPLDSELTPQLR